MGSTKLDWARVVLEAAKRKRGCAKLLVQMGQETNIPSKETSVEKDRVACTGFINKQTL